MCGISVILDPSGSPRLISRLVAMHAVIRHRGPDGEGFLVVDRSGTVARAEAAGQLRATTAPLVGLAFRRLKICDLTEAAAQPMGSPDRRTWIVFNGEIYNFRDLRRELEAKGRDFHTTGDTEVALAAYEEWGEHCFARLDGMWAIAILDLRRNRLVVSRDRFGIKPLLWTIDDGGAMLFASEIKQLIAATEERARRAPTVRLSQCTFTAGVIRRSKRPSSKGSALSRRRRGARSTSPGLASRASNGIGILPTLPPIRTSSPTMKPSFVLRSCSRARSPPIASRTSRSALCSRGASISSTLVALAHRDGPKLPTYSLGYRDAAPDFCEMRYVDAMTRRDGIENHETTFDAAWIDANTDRILWTLEEPPLAMPAFAQFRLFELCAQHGATVILDGQGADEISAGYSYHQRLFIKDRLLRRQPLAMLSELRAIGRREQRFTAAVFADFFIWPRLQRRARFPWIADAGMRTNAVEFASALGDHGRDRSLVNQQLYVDVCWGNVKIVLGYGDRSAMAHSVEARVPYFDREFVELLFSLPDAYKIGNGDRKHILRDVARRYVPPEITERPDRMGFGTPDEEVIRGPLRGAVADAVNDPAFRAAGWIVPSEASRFLDDFQQGLHNDYRAVWRLFALSRWARRFSLTG